MRKIIPLLFFQLLISGSAFSSTFHVDPINGGTMGDGSFSNPWPTLEWVIGQNLISTYKYVTPYDVSNPQLVPKNSGAPIGAGDTIVLYEGLHGDIFLQNYINEQYITLMAADGHVPILKKIKLQACKNWKLYGLTISSEPYGEYINDRLVYVESHNWQGPSSNVEIINCEIYSTDEPWAIADDWINKASRGIYIKGDSVNIFNNYVRNISFGISMVGDFIQTIGNTVENFSGDGMRILGSNILTEGNIIKNCYDVDENHDDGIQSFTTNGYVVDNNIVRGNLILNYEDPNQPLLGPLQGMGFFDGFFNNWLVENNVIAVNHWHGITFLGANNCKIYNNTVLDPSPDITPGASWIRIDDHKNGTPSSGCEVKNNVANTFNVDGELANNMALGTYAEYAENFVDYENYDFHLIENSPLIDAANGDVSPPYDFDGTPRPQGSQPDIGAFEFQMVSNLFSNDENDAVKISPNPFYEHTIISGDVAGKNISVFDCAGKYVCSFICSEKENVLTLPNGKSGLFFIHLYGPSGELESVHKVIRY